MSSVTLYLLGIKSYKLGGCFMGNSPIVWCHNPIRAALRGLWRHLWRWLVSVHGLKLKASRLHRIAVKRVIKSVIHKTAFSENSTQKSGRAVLKHSTSVFAICCFYFSFLAVVSTLRIIRGIRFETVVLFHPSSAVCRWFGSLIYSCW